MGECFSAAATINYYCYYYEIEELRQDSSSDVDDWNFGRAWEVGPGGSESAAYAILASSLGTSVVV